MVEAALVTPELPAYYASSSSAAPPRRSSAPADLAGARGGAGPSHVVAIDDDGADDPGGGGPGPALGLCLDRDPDVDQARDQPSCNPLPLEGTGTVPRPGQAPPRHGPGLGLAVVPASPPAGPGPYRPGAASPPLRRPAGPRQRHRPSTGGRDGRGRGTVVPEEEEEGGGPSSSSPSSDARNPLSSPKRRRESFEMDVFVLDLDQ